LIPPGNAGFLVKEGKAAEMTNVAWVFPGQGSQSVGMGRDLYNNVKSARAIFEQADEALGFSISRLCFEGPEEELRQTINAQPALVTVSFACLEAAREIGRKNLPEPAFTAGHSLGEYTALAVAGVFDFPTAVRLARERGRLMHEAGQKRPGGMAAIIGLDEARLTEVIARAMAMATSAGASRTIPLQVSGAFHSPLMQPAVEGITRYIDTVTFRNPSIPVIGNTTTEPLNDAEAVKTELRRQLNNPVQWQQTIEYMVRRGVNTFIEIGPGRVLTGLIKRINREVKTVNIGDLAAVEILARGL
jgi:[acyl-carrier-protein] S-malonyltransferase